MLQGERSNSSWSGRSGFDASCWSQTQREDIPALCCQMLEPGVPVQLLEQGRRVSASRKMWQEHLGSPKAATGDTGLGVSSLNGACMCLSVCLLGTCSATIAVKPVNGKLATVPLNLGRDARPTMTAQWAVPDSRAPYSLGCCQGTVSPDPFLLLAFHTCSSAGHSCDTSAPQHQAPRPSPA